jgi:hypothetical protein
MSGPVSVSRLPTARPLCLEFHSAVSFSAGKQDAFPTAAVTVALRSPHAMILKNYLLAARK